MVKFKVIGHGECSIKDVHSSKIKGAIHALCLNELTTMTLLVYRTYHGDHVYSLYGSTAVDGSSTTQLCGELGDIDCSIAILVCAPSAAEMQLLMNEMYREMQAHIASNDINFVPHWPSPDQRARMHRDELFGSVYDVVMAAVHTWNPKCIMDAIAAGAQHIVEEFWPLMPDNIDDPKMNIGAMQTASAMQTEAFNLRQYAINKLISGARTFDTVVASAAVRCAKVWIGLYGVRQRAFDSVLDIPAPNVQSPSKNREWDCEDAISVC